MCFVDSRLNTILDKEYLTTKDASVYLTEKKGIGTTERTLRTWITRGNGPAFFKMGRQVFYTKQTIDAWIESKISSMQFNSLNKRDNS